jgi:hypothetical protein
VSGQGKSSAVKKEKIAIVAFAKELFSLAFPAQYLLVKNSVVASDPDSDWNWIQAGKNYPPKKEKVKKFHVLICWIFSLEGRRLLLSFMPHVPQ